MLRRSRRCGRRSTSSGPSLDRPSPPGLVFCGDDFTGASDTLATLARAGWRTRLYLDAEDALADPASRALDAVGVATALRSLAPGPMAAELDRQARALAAFGAPVFHYKVCSTFDSSPTIGNIATAVATVRAAVPAIGWLAIVGGQPSLRRYCLFGNLFAAAGDGAVHRIDRHPVMGHHPVTPMTEADLRLHLAAQGLEGVALIDRRHYADGVAALAELVHGLRAEGRDAVLFDAGEQADLPVVGAMLRDQPGPVLCVGASSVAEAVVAAAAPRADVGATAPPALKRTARPCFALSGSRSPVTERQIAAATGFREVPIDPQGLATDRRAGIAAAVAASLDLLRQGRPVLARLLPGARHGLSGAALAEATAEIAAAVTTSGLCGALVVAGGDTSSLAARALGLRSLTYVSDVDRGAALCRADAEGPLDGFPLVLKGGQMGSEDFFGRVQAVLER